MAKNYSNLEAVNPSFIIMHVTHSRIMQLWLHHVDRVMLSITQPVPTAGFKHSSNRLFTTELDLSSN